MDNNSLFDEFETSSHQAWKEKIISDLKGKPFEDLLIWEDENKIQHQPYYTKSSHPNRALIENIQNAQKKSKHWRSIQVFDANSQGSEKQVAESLANGANFAFINNTKEYKKYTKLKKGDKNIYLLINEIDLDHLPKRFLIDPIGNQLKGDTFASKNLELLPSVFKLRLNDLDPDYFLMIDGNIYKKAGATIVQELAYTLQHAMEYLDLMTEKGFKASAIARSFIFKLGYGNSYFSEIAKGRAFQYLLQKLYSSYHVKNTAIIWGQGSSYYHSHKDPYTNLLRLSSQAMSAILGNCNLISLPAYDEHEEASSLGLRMSKNIPLILREESSFAEVRDPSSGSYYLEQLTAEIAEKAWNFFLTIEKEGGLLKRFEKGILENELSASHQARVQTFQGGKRVMLGVNKFINENKADLKIKEASFNGIASRIISKDITT
ncbi:MAG: hypothetical protein JKY48_14095 [Flavobacteriales bacterium]|nr:hypothetical protein [Flavobacteriales bacterium]